MKMKITAFLLFVIAAVACVVDHDFSPYVIGIAKNSRAALSSVLPAGFPLRVLSEDDAYAVGEVTGEGLVDHLELELGLRVDRLYLKTAAYNDYVRYWEAQASDFKYHNYKELQDKFESLKRENPGVFDFFTIGKSVKGKELWTGRINVSPTVPKPRFLWVANMHGDEAVGRELVILMADYLLTEYKKNNTRITHLLSNVEITLNPSMNPDGFERKRRGNSNGYDLNRNFPDYFQDPRDTPEGRQIETAHIMNFRKIGMFDLTLNYHGGALVALYSLSNKKRGGMERAYCASADDKLMIHISKSYTKSHPKMRKGGYKDGICNICSFYYVKGGINDWSYMYRKVPDVAVEVSNSKYPPASALKGFWEDNREPMLNYMEQTLIGFYGTVTDASGAPIAMADVVVEGINHAIHSKSDGWYYRLITGGSYRVKAEAAGYQSEIKSVVVKDGERVLLNFTLKKK